MPQEPVKIVLIIEGGILQEVITCGVPVEYALIDYDTEGNDLEDIFQVPQGDGKTAEAVGHKGIATVVDPDFCLKLFNSPKRDLN